MEIGVHVARLAPVLTALAIATLIEAIAPLRDQPQQPGRLATNLWLLVITLALGMLLNLTLALGTAYVAQNGLGLLQLLGVGAVASFIVTLLALDGASYLVHRLMHQVPTLWRVHLAHHIDRSVDATTALRQHPIEGVLRFGFIAATAWALGAPLAAVALYRLLGTLNSVLEHANIRVPRWLDRVLVVVWVTPDMHKVHHSREQAETDSNYANLFSFFDRMFRTYVSSARGGSVDYGIRGFDAPEQHSIGAVLSLPFKSNALVSTSAIVAGMLVAIAICAPPSRAAEPPAAQVLFVCEHGNVKSLMAANYFNELAVQRRLRLRAVSRGSAPDSTTVPAPIVAALRAEGFDVGAFRPTAVSAADVSDSARIVTIGAKLPPGAGNLQSQIQEWNDVPPASTNYAAASAALRAHVRDLIEQLSHPASQEPTPERQ